MRAKKFVCCLLAMLLLAGVSFISCGNSSKAKADSELTHPIYIYMQTVHR